MSREIRFIKSLETDSFFIKMLDINIGENKVMFLAELLVLSYFLSGFNGFPLFFCWL